MLSEKDRERIRLVADEVKLTRGQSETLIHVAAGLSNMAVGEQLGIAEGTVKYHLTNIYRSFRVRSRSELMEIINGRLRQMDVIPASGELPTGATSLARSAQPKIRQRKFVTYLDGDYDTGQVRFMQLTYADVLPFLNKKCFVTIELVES